MASANTDTTKLVFKKVEHATDEILNAMAHVAAEAYRHGRDGAHDDFTRACVADNWDLGFAFQRGVVGAQQVGGENWIALDNDKIVAVAGWFPPGRELLGDPKQMDAGWGAFAEKWTPEMGDWWMNYFLPRYAQATNDALGNPDRKKQSWHLQMLVVLPDPNSADKEIEMCLESEVEANTAMYTKWGWKVQGNKTDFESPHGNFSILNTLNGLLGLARLASTDASSKAFSKTLLLPKTQFPMRNDRSRDVSIQKRTTEDLYRWQSDNAKGPLFVFHDGPPYANGDLHIGHALNKVLKDIVNRYRVIIGDRVHYHPGWDCHGLPIENKVLKELGKDMHEVSPSEIRRAAEVYAKGQVQSQMDQFRQLGVMAQWSADTTYRTLDHGYEIRQLRVFQKMVERGLIYRHYRPVYYSPSSRSALAEAELEYKDNHVSHSVYVSFELDLHQDMPPSLRKIVQSAFKVQLLVWTTTPWTLSANMGIAVNAEMTYTVLRSSEEPDSGLVVVATERLEALKEILESMKLDITVGEITGVDLAGASYRPLFASKLPPETPSLRILPSGHVTSLSGTGLVHCAPAHGQEDYQLFHSLGFIPAGSSSSVVCHVDGSGCFTAEVTNAIGEMAGRSLIGKEVLEEGGKAMVALLKELGVLRKIQRIKHRYPYDWRTDKPVVTTATSQWFANLDAIKDDAIALLQNVQFVPEESRRRLESFIRQRSEWCISRQRVWGVPIPALYHLPTNRAVLDSTSLDHILSILEEKGVRHWWDGPVEDFVPTHLRVEGENVAETWQKGTDTMDVWFDSGTSWSMLQNPHAGQETEDVVYMADVCIEGTDQHRGWFQSQLLTLVGSTPEKQRGKVGPYKTLITHGMVLDENGKKMSKSLGNIVSPLTVINGGKDKKKEPAYGADILRLWAASTTYWHDTSIGPKTLAQAEEMYRKLRNSLRFVLGNLRDQRLSEEQKVRREDMSLTGKYVMHELYKLENHARKNYAEHIFSEVTLPLSRFVNTTLSSLYFDITKDILYADPENSLRRREVLTISEHILDTMTSIFAPIVPHLAEEVHQILHSGNAQILSVFSQPWVPLDPMWYDEEVEKSMSKRLQLRSKVMSLLEQSRTEKHIGNALEADVEITSKTAEGEPYHDAEFTQLFNVSAVRIVPSLSSQETEQLQWSYDEPVTIDGLGDCQLQVCPARQHKCPRCWMHTREAHDELCGRCAGIVKV
ncbi:isoleucine-tRNA ligase [Steccherinum ochraceum]|uniref:Isoleucine--tRNA ligase, mitochondrial n=1 Tax=Steccherinum ochraceum TaxID=92696 RepID=A0A4R0RVE3_9APHY|nr:isoleucine-tRNA ligase [Steccherinum ochraceum]